jgi:hypothetical protein
MKQQGALFAIQALSGTAYDESRPLENFLYTHVRNRFINYKRDNYLRNEVPCKTCIFYDKHLKLSTNACSAFPEDKTECPKLSDWEAKNTTKKNIMKPLDASMVTDRSLECESSVFEDVSFAELETAINVGLPAELRSDYLRMRQHQVIPKSRRQKVREAVLIIKKEFYGENEVE